MRSRARTDSVRASLRVQLPAPLTLAALAPTATKRCRGRCRELKPLSAFDVEPWRDDGHSKMCTACIADRAAQAAARAGATKQCPQCSKPKTLGGLCFECATGRARTLAPGIFRAE